MGRYDSKCPKVNPLSLQTWVSMIGKLCVGLGLC